ncbi:MAG: AAA family ATPase [Alphaproteobacteria bacterium]|nr:AAA family ATPase [Alphaproteobacteria bacterium]MBU1560028.1 AAA family ATPase [Alphaproteobacteria bacterium]MBU2302330.1 AAA family ATPase [Alphaproteobacteria bacterium]MBU2369396.1 AAA family ATPase [Alphaproteobacteria bacterium]
MNKIVSPSNIAIITSAVWTTFESLHITHDALTKAHEQFDAVRLAHAKTKDNGRPRRCLCLFAPSHSGKSHTVTSYIHNNILPGLMAEDPALAAMDADELARKQKKVVHVTLSAQATPKSLATDILIALEDPEPDKGTKATLWRRVYRLITSLGVELLVIDEVQHLANKRIKITETGAPIVFDHSRDQNVADTLKVMMIRGSVPLVFIGILQARDLVMASTQFKGRVLDEIHFETPRWAIEKERLDFMSFCGRLALKLKDTGLFDETPPLVNDDIPSRLYVASRGRLGLLCRIVEKATILALTRGKKVLSRKDLEEAVDIIIVGRGELPENPFHAAPKTLELV